MEKSMVQNKITQSNVFINIVFCTLVCALIISRDVYHMAISSILFVAVFLLFFLFSDIQNSIVVLCFSFPLLCGLPGNWILLGFIGIYILKNKFQFNVKIFLVPLIIVISELAHIFFLPDLRFGLLDVLRYIIYILLIQLIVFGDQTINYKKCLKYFSVGIVVTCLIIFLTTLDYYSVKTIFDGTFRYGYVSIETANQNMILSNNSNNIGYYCVLGISSLLTLNVVDRKSKAFNFFLIIVTSMFGILTMSRAFFLVAIGLIILYSFLSFKISLKLIFNLVLALVLLGVLFYVLNFLFSNVFQGMIERFNESDVTGGRNNIFSIYSDFIKSHPIYLIFGTGLLGMKEVVGITTAPHNGFQQIFVAYGIIGFVAFIAIVYYLIKKSKGNSSSVPKVAYLLVIVMLVYVQSIQLLNPFELMLPFIICSFSIKMFANDRLNS